ncbi:MAG: metallophosphoesterase [Burkholderiales bacterium]|nr:metallophosphoesterase [Phycisphaerae bacterium]
MLRFIHITDTHIGPTADFELYGHRPLLYLRRLVKLINDLPFEIDFVLHTGDCVDDGSAASYALFHEAMSPLRIPVKYVVGNHDDSSRLQALMNVAGPTRRMDYAFEVRGIKFVVLDTRGPVDPGGHVEPAQIDWLKHHCTIAGPPLVIAMHHSPIRLDTPWLDAPPPDWNGRFMFIDNADAVIDALQPARDRILGVFGGHVHGLYQSMYKNLLFVSGQSTFSGLSGWPSEGPVEPDIAQSAMFNVVSVMDNQIVVRPRCFELE